MLADYLVKHKVNLQVLAAAPRADYPVPVPSEQPASQQTQPSGSTQPMMLSALLTAARAAMPPSVSTTSASMAPSAANASMLLQNLGSTMPVLLSRFSQAGVMPAPPEPLSTGSNGPAVLSALLNVPTDPLAVRMEQLPPELQQVLVPMFIAWLKRLMGTH